MQWMKRYLFLFTALPFLASDAAVNGPDFVPPFEQRQIKRQKFELVSKSFREKGKAHDAFSLASGNKRIAVRETALNRMNAGEERITIFLNDVPTVYFRFVGGYKKDGKWTPYAQLRDHSRVRLTGNKEDGVIHWENSYTLPDGSPAVFRYQLKTLGNGKVELSWNTGYSEDQAEAFRKQGVQIGNGCLLYLSIADCRKHVLKVNGKTLVYTPETVLKEKKSILLWSGKVETLIMDPEKKAECLEIQFEKPFPMSFREQFSYRRFSGGFMGSSNAPAGKMILDFGETGVKSAGLPPAVEGNDFWTMDALHVPHSPTRNLLPNPGFEQGLRYWNWVDGGAQYSRSAVPRFQVVDGGLSGRKMLVVNPVQTRAAGLASTALPGKKDQKYTVSWYAKAEKPGSAAKLTLYSRKWGGKFDRSYLEKDKPFPLTSEWKRYSQTFVSDGAPIALVLNVSGGGKIWLDGIQYERGESATGFVSPSLEGVLRTSDPDNCVEFGKPLNAEFEILGKGAGKAEFSLFDFYKKELWKKTYDVKAGMRLALPLDSKQLQQGIFFLRVKYEIPGTKPYFDFHRFTILKSLNNTHRTKDLFGGLLDTRTFRTEDYLALRRRFGMGGSASYGNGHENDPLQYELRKKFGITDYTHTLILPKETAAKRIADPDYKLKMMTSRMWRRKSEQEIPYLRRYSPEVLKRVEEMAYRCAKRHPEVRVWTWATEEETVVPAIQERDFAEYAKFQEAFYKGFKRGNPGSFVMPSGGTSGFGRIRGRSELRGYLKATRGKVKWDAVAVHPYGAIDGVGECDDLDEVLQLLSSDMAEFGYGKETPIFLNEGFGVNPVRWGDGPDYTYRATNYTYDLGLWEFLHAAKHARVFLICLKYPQVKHFNTWQSFNREMIDNELTPVASLKAVNTLGNLFGDPVFVDDIRPASGMRGYAFRNEKGQGLAALWCTLSDVELGHARGPVMNVRFSGPPPTLIDLMGRECKLKKEKDGSVNIQLTPAPLFLLGGDPAALASDLQNASVSGAGSSVAVSFAPDLDGSVSAKIANLTGKAQSGKLRIGNRSIPFKVDGKKTENIILNAPENLLPGRLYQWKYDYTLDFPGLNPVTKHWNMEYFVVPRVNGAPDWSKIPAVPMTNRYLPVVNLKRVPGGHPGDFSAKYQLAWDSKNLYLRVEAEDDSFNPDHPKFWDSKVMQKNQLYLLDGCLEVYFDCGANGRTGKGGYDLDDYRYDFCAGNREGRSGPGRVCRLREVYLEYGGGVNMPSKEEAAGKIKCEFTRISKTKYAYTITFGQRYLEPLSLKAGTIAGVALFLHDKENNLWKGLSTAVESGSHCDFRPDLWPLMILGK